MAVIEHLRNHLGLFLREHRLLGPTYRALFVKERVRHARSNRYLRNAHPDVRFPPEELLYETTSTTSLRVYWDGGIRRANYVYEVIDRLLPAGPLHVLEWGCGVARVVRHLPAIGRGRPVKATGADYMARSIQWCEANIPDVQFAVNALEPPLPFEDDTFDALYCLSVHTHLSENLQRRWLKESLRVVRPGGIVLLSVHGDAYDQRLTRAERERYRTVGVVERSGVDNGTPWYTTYNSPHWMENTFLTGLEIVHRDLAANRQQPVQDTWAVRVPG